MANCSQCKQEITCPDHTGEGFNHQAINQSVLPCAKTCSIWVRAIDDNNAVVMGVTAVAGSKSDDTKGQGFAKLEDLPAGEHEVNIVLPQSANEDYQPIPASQSKRHETLAKGDLKLITVRVKRRVTPIIELSSPAVAVHGKNATITLKTDIDYTGPGTFTCTQGSDKLEFTPALTAGKLEIANCAGPQEITVKARGDASALNGVAFEWKIDASAQKGPATTATMTVVKASLKVYKKSGSALTDGEKGGDGRTVHLQKPGKDWTRAKTEVEVLPAEYAGHVLLALTEPKLKLYDADKAGAEIDLSAKIAVGPGITPTYYAGGVSLSGGKADTKLQLNIDKLADVVDQCNFTVMETTLQIHGLRLNANTDPVAIPEDQKALAGRTLYKQRTKLTGQRALLMVTKLPLDAPCKLNIMAAAGGPKLVYYEATGERTHNDMTTNAPVTLKHSNEVPVHGVAGKSFPREIAVDEVKDQTAAAYKPEEKHLYRGLAFWLEGLAVSTAQEAKLQVDADEVDDACDIVAATVAQPKLDIEVLRKPVHVLDDDLDFKLTAPGQDAPLVTGVIPKNTGKVTVNVDAGFYGLAITPRNADERKMRQTRLEPADSETSLSVLADAKVKLQLEPPYEKVQCVGYFMRSGAYVGVDANVPPVAYLVTDDEMAREQKRQQFREARRLQALDDIDGRCAIMLDAVQNAYNAAQVLKNDETVVKIFMGPEFYFRGQQGAYPISSLEEILTPPTNPVKPNIQALKTELDDPKYKDWIFVLGTAIGAIELDTDVQRTEVSGQITAVTPSVKLTVWLENTNPACAVTGGWKIYTVNSNQMALVNGAVHTGNSGIYRQYTLQSPGYSALPDKPAALGHGVEQVTFVAKQAQLQVNCAAVVPQVGWTVQQGLFDAAIVRVTPIGGTMYELQVNVVIDETFAAAAAEIFDGANAHAADITNTIDSAVFVQVVGGSFAANVGADWRLWSRAAAPVLVAGDQSYVISNVVTISATDRALIFAGGVIHFPAANQLFVGDLHPVAEMGTEKLVTVDVQFTAAVAVAKGHFLEIGGNARGLVESTTDLGANKHRISIWMPLEKTHGLTSGNSVTFATPGTAEIINIALVRKGGSGTPVRADGGAQKELLVYKETVSSVDFEGIDYSRGPFGRDDRRIVKLYGDPSRRARATAGSSTNFSYGLADSATTNEPGAPKAGGGTVTETNRSGLGGGSIFTMDGITFGLEVCLDHGEGKLVRYFNGRPPTIASAAVPGEPKVQVQLIPSCGMGIRDNAICTVTDGIVFNVDAYEYGCRKNGGGVVANKLEQVALTPPTAATYFVTTETALTGFIEVYEAIDKPTPEFV